MAGQGQYVVLPGSQRDATYLDHAITGEADGAQPMTVTLCLRPAIAINPAVRRTRQEFVGLHGPLASDVVKVCRFAEGAGLAVVDCHDAAATIKLTGTVAQMNAAFDVRLCRAHSAQGDYRTRTGTIRIPEELLGIVTAVEGLDERPLAKPHFRLRQASVPHAASPVPLYPDQVAKAMHFPPMKGNGSNTYIGIISLGGGYLLSDLQMFCAARGIPMPDIEDVSVDGAVNSPGDDADVENLLDIQTIWGILAQAGGTQAHIRVFFCPNTAQGFLDGQNAAYHYAVPAGAGALTVVSISWGSPEAQNTAMSLSSQDQAAQAGCSLGVTTCSASGDNGSSDGASGKNVDFMASSPHVWGVGGTLLVVGADGARVLEEAWGGVAGDGATGGGVSAKFALPGYQTAIGVQQAGRCVPDSAANADPQSGYLIVVNGQWQAIGGTSGATPATAALFAILNSYLPQSLGWAQGVLYQLADCFYDVTSGSNGAYAAAVGFDEVSGLGVPDGARLVAKLTGSNPPLPPAPVPPPVVPPAPPITPPVAPTLIPKEKLVEQLALHLRLAVHSPAVAGDDFSVSK